MTPVIHCDNNVDEQIKEKHLLASSLPWNYTAKLEEINRMVK